MNLLPFPTPAGFGPWRISSSSDPASLRIVDGLGRFREHGPHYSRRSPGSKTFTGVGREVVLVTECGRAVWAVVLQKTPPRKGSGSSRGRTGAPDNHVKWVFRNMMFRNLGAGLSSELIRWAVGATHIVWVRKYGAPPPVRMRTEVNLRKVRSTNPGYCYQMAGWTKGQVKRGLLHLYEPTRSGQKVTVG